MDKYELAPRKPVVAPCPEDAKAEAFYASMGLIPVPRSMGTGIARGISNNLTSCAMGQPAAFPLSSQKQTHKIELTIIEITLQ